MKNGVLITFTAVLFALAAPNANAESIYAIFNGKSYHIDSSYDWNEQNTGLGIEYEFSQKGAWKKVAMANGFRDSMNEMSYMAGFGLHRRIYETERFAGLYVYAGLNAFLMTRDDFNNGRPFPGILPSLSVGNQRFGLNLTYLPSGAIEELTNSKFIDPTIEGIVFLQLKVSLDQLLP
ncbi:MAG: hypothetical protein AAFN50_09135 [Pseudomonadota bacterium]